MIPKPTKPITSVTFYRPIFLLLVLSKILEKQLLKRLFFSVRKKNMIPDHQFGFRRHYSTSHQVIPPLSLPLSSESSVARV